MIHSYPSVYAIGHKAIEGLFNGPVLVEEKIDGSQFSFGIVDGELQCRSKGKLLVLDAPEALFERAVAQVVARQHLLRPDWIYRGEYLSKPKHNTLAYGRVPRDNIIIFDISSANEEYLGHGTKVEEAARIGLECVPVFFQGLVTDMAMLNVLLERESCLGGTRIEGVVVKNYGLFTAEKKVAMGKYVSEAFKEKHETDWKERNPGRADVVESLIATYRTEARWHKAVQHLREADALTDSPKDIGALIREVPADVLKEDVDAIKQVLFRHFWPQIQRGITAGLPEWYKQQLASRAFEQDA
jgi:hypothetical protein